MAAQSGSFLTFSSITATTSGQKFSGGIATVAVDGTFNSATVKLQASFDGTNWIDVGSDVEFTADGMGNIEISPCELRFNVSGGTPSGMTGYVVKAKDVKAIV